MYWIWGERNPRQKVQHKNIESVLETDNLSVGRVNYNMKLSGEKYLEGLDRNSWMADCLKFRIYPINSEKYSECLESSIFM